MPITDRLDSVVFCLRKNSSAVCRLLVVFFYYVIGVIYYQRTEGWSIQDCLYFITGTLGKRDCYLRALLSNLFLRQRSYRNSSSNICRNYRTWIRSLCYHRRYDLVSMNVCNRMCLLLRIRQKSNVLLQQFAGYGAFVPTTDSARIFTCFYVLFGIAFVLTAAIDVAKFVIARVQRRLLHRINSSDNMIFKEMNKMGLSFLFLIIAVLMGTCFFAINEEWTAAQAFYWTIVTMTVSQSIPLPSSFLSCCNSHFLASFLCNTLFIQNTYILFRRLWDMEIWNWNTTRQGDSYSTWITYWTSILAINSIILHRISALLHHVLTPLFCFLCYFTDSFQYSSLCTVC